VLAELSLESNCPDLALGFHTAQTSDKAFIRVAVIKTILGF